MIEDQSQHIRLHRAERNAKIPQEAVNSLPALQKYIIYRYYFGEATIEQIASELGGARIRYQHDKKAYSIILSAAVWISGRRTARRVNGISSLWIMQ
jgi:DNA-directed RNA polymerase specialized sigma subunit